MKRLVTLLAAVVLCTAFLIGTQPRTKDYRIADGNRINFGHLLSDLLDAYENDSPQAQDRLTFDLETIKAVNSKDYHVARAISDHWKNVYLDPDYHLNLYYDDIEASEIANSGIPNTSSHAFVVLGYELKDGEMTDELKGRCEAAAAAAKMYPNSILVCSGGATGANNPEHHTEAGMMRDYLAEQCGISPDRIFTDERAMTTAENAVNTLAILKSRVVTPMESSVTSSEEPLYTACPKARHSMTGFLRKMEAHRGRDTGVVLPVQNEAFRNDARIAIGQLGSILHIPRQAMNS